MQEALYRIIDANYNRAREGLRVCEDIFRFLLYDGSKAVEVKKIRRKLAEIISEFPVDKLLQARDVDRDSIKFKLVGSHKVNVYQLLRRNFQRVTEALRVLEEISLILNPIHKKRIMRLRFRIYDLEKLSIGER